MNYNDDKIKEILQSEDIPQKIQPESIKNMLDNTNAVKKRKQIKRSRVVKMVSAAAAFVLVFTAGAYYAMPLLQKNEIIEYSSSESHDSSNVKSDYEDGVGYLRTDVRPESIGSLSYAKSYEDVYDLYIEPRKPSALERIQSYIFGYSYKYTDKVYYEEALEDDAAAEEDMEMPDMENGSSINGAISDGMGAGDATAGGAGGDYSKTYNQEEGVIEADIVKTNGDQIFFSTGDKIVCSEVENGIFKSNTIIYPLKDITDIHADWIEDMYLFGDELIVIGTGFKAAPDHYDVSVNYDKPVTFVATYDIETLELCSSYVQDGFYTDVRMTSLQLYLITNKTMYIDYFESEQKNYEEYIPSCMLDGEEKLCSAEDILLPAECPEDFHNLEYTIVSAINLMGSNNEIIISDTQVISGGTDAVYCTENNLYIASGYSDTEITRFKISDKIIPQAAGTVNGYVNDQFSISEYNGYLRIATTINGWVNHNNESAEWNVSSNTYNNCLYVLDMDMNVVGSVDDFGIDETIRSVNFNGDMAYIVTFMQTDPLYAIDLSVPENPVILDEFKITGYSSYMQTWGDGLLVGFGAEADETGWETGVKLTMFDNSDPENLKALDTISISEDPDSDMSYISEGTGDRKALYIDPERNIIGFPLDVWKYDYTTYQSETKCSYEFYSFENGSFQPLGSMYKNYYKDDIVTEPFKRAVYIDGYLYALSGDMFISANAETFEQADLCEFGQRKYSELKEEYLYD